MEQINLNPTISNSKWYHNRWFKIAVIIVVVILIIFGLYKIYRVIFPSVKLSKEFVTKLSEISDSNRDITNGLALDLTGLNEKESAADFDGALKIVKAVETKNEEMPAKLTTLINKTAELKALAEKITDPTVKESALKLVTLLERRNTTNFEFVYAQMQMIQESVSYYDNRKAGKTVNLPTDFPLLTEQAIKIAGDLKNINAEYAEAVKDLAKKSGVAQLNSMAK